MKKGDIIEVRTIDKKGFISFNFLKIKDARIAKRLLTERGYHQTEPRVYFASEQYTR